MSRTKITKISNFTFRIFALVLITAICVSCLYGCNNDEPGKVRKFIDKHSHTVYTPPSGWGATAYRDIQFSSTEIAGIGYWEEFFCLYSRSYESTYVGSLGKIEYTVFCEIVFEWDDFGSNEFYASVIFERKDNPGHTVGYAEATNWASVPHQNPHFTDIIIYENSTELSNEQMENIASLRPYFLVQDANKYLEAVSLPTLH